MLCLGTRRPCDFYGPFRQCSRGTGSLVVRSAVEGENWEAAVCLESQCVAVVTRKQAWERAEEEETGDTPTESGGAQDPPTHGGGVGYQLG